MKQWYTTGFLLFLAINTLLAQSSYWAYVTETSFPEKGVRQIVPQTYKTVKLNVAALQSILDNAPLEYNASQATLTVALPMPDGSIEDFKVVESPIMEAGLAVKFPNIKTYLGQGIDNPRAMVRFGWTDKGFHAIVISEKGRFFIDPYSTQETEHYIVYNKKDLLPTQNHECLVKENDFPHLETHNGTPLHNQTESSGDELRTYRIAISATAEYANFHGGTINSVMSELAVLMNRVNGIYETEVDVRMILVANNDQLIYFNANTDPFNNTNSNQIVNQNQTVIDNIIGSANYDIGHVVSTGGGGYAPGPVCQNGFKARAVTGLGSPIGDPFYIDYVCHEIGHQFSAGHSFNGSTGNCAGAIWTNSSYEPGSGTTIMGYAGICAPQNIQNNSHDYFHTHNFDQIRNYTTVTQGNTCAVVTPTGNSEPNVIAGTGGFTIPKSTPFELIGSATDPDGDSLTYCWEQYDLGPQGAPNTPTGNAPLFRSFLPVTVPSRTFPKMSDIVNNTQTMGEILPSYGRSLSFRLTARDNKAGGGGVNYDGISFNVTNNAGPFLVTRPNTNAETWLEGAPAEITWDVANTDASPVNCAKVDILLSMDGGYTYPITLATNVDNNGATTILVPQNTATNSARVRIQCATSIFFDISNQNFNITAPTAPGFVLWGINTEQTVCAPDEANFTLDLIPLLNFNDAINITASGMPNGLALAYNQNPTAAGQPLTITATNTATIPTGTYPIQLLATGGNVSDSATIYLTVYSVTPTVVSPVAPIDGFTGASANPKLIWDGTAPHTYTLQLATDPSFTNLVVNQSGITENSYVVQGLNGYSVYYWRVKADNQCVTGEFSTTYTFRTATLACETFGGVTPRALASSVALTYPSNLVIPEDFELVDVNVRNLEGVHTFINDLTFRLTSPAGTEVLLFDQICGNQNNFDIDLDDDAASANYPCPPTNGQAYQPQGVLANFNGENSYGTWVLSIQDHKVGDGGRVDNWELELCKATANTNADPIIIKNAPLPVQRHSSRNLTEEFLLATDADNNAAELIFTIIEATSAGKLILNGVELAIGSTFTQAEISANSLKYMHNEGGSDADKFRFHVADGVGGWAGSPNFTIEIVEDVNVFGLEGGQAWIYPNPTSANLNIALRLDNPETIKISIYDMIGQQIIRDYLIDGQVGTNALTLDTLYLVNGVYILVIEGQDFSTTEKFVIQKK